MKLLPLVHMMPRVDQDVNDCVAFIRKHPRGNPVERRRDLHEGIKWIRSHPRANPIEALRLKTGLELRKHHAAQFVIIYAYLEPNAVIPDGLVTIRAVRHRRVRDPFQGVKEGSAFREPVCSRMRVREYVDQGARTAAAVPRPALPQADDTVRNYARKSCKVHEKPA